MIANDVSRCLNHKCSIRANCKRFLQVAEDYKDKSMNDNSYVYQAGFPTYTWNEFNDYCHEMYSREVLAFDQELIDNIDDSTIIDIQEDIDINDVGNIDEVINEINILYMNNTN